MTKEINLSFMLSTGKSKLPDNTVSAFSSDKVICLATRSSKRF